MNDCPLSRFPGGLTTLHLAGDEAIKWLGMQCKRSEDHLDQNVLADPTAACMSVCLSVCLSVRLCIVALTVGVGPGLKVLPSCFSSQGTSYSLLQTLLLYDVSFRHNTQRKTEPPKFPHLE